MAAFKKNGFVVSERMGAASFAEQFYRIFSRDLPVFISSDALLHAWHRSYDAILEELEETYLAQSLDEILAGMAEQLAAANKTYGKGILGDSITDADYFLAVARSLLAGQTVKSHLGNDNRVAETLRACEGLRLQEFTLFGRDRKVDFSQFKVRGHYENSELLKRYFKAMMWCGRIDLRVAGGKDENRTASSPRELGAAAVLHELLKKSGKFEQWQQFDRMIQTFVGRTDSMTFAQLGGVLAKGGINSLADVKDVGTLKALQADILSGKIGLQHIRSHYVVSSPFGPDKAELPRSFTLLGQKFVVDSWVTAKVVADEIFWDDRKVQRRVPSCLDVAFAALGNDQVVPNLVQRMGNAEGHRFRDGLNYQHNLAAVRRVIDAQNKAVWDENLYLNWLATLRELSKPTTDAKYPEAMRTHGWAMKTLNTQTGIVGAVAARHHSVCQAVVYGRCGMRIPGRVRRAGAGLLGAVGEDGGTGRRVDREDAVPQPRRQEGDRGRRPQGGRAADQPQGHAEETGRLPARLRQAGRTVEEHRVKAVGPEGVDGCRDEGSAGRGADSPQERLHAVQRLVSEALLQGDA